VGGLDALVQAVFVVGVLALEMLGTQQQAFAPEYFAAHRLASVLFLNAASNRNDKHSLSCPLLHPNNC
jgi:hypothetical protein